MYIYCILVLISQCITAQDERHTVEIPISPTAKNVLFKVSNDNKNQHAISQTTMMRLDTTQTTAANPAPAVVSSGLLALGWLYKGTIALGVLGAGYAGLLAVLLRMERKITAPDAWGTWHADRSLESLMAVPPKELASLLFEDIKKRYLPTEYSFINFLDPLISFMTVCDQEISDLEYFINMRAGIASTPLLYIIPPQTELIARAHENLARLKYLKQLMVSWLSEYSLTSSTSA